MNDRIRELADQAAEDVPNTHMNIPDEFCEKFAELILKQCLSYVDDSFGDVDYVKFMIKRDFGVEQ